MRKVGIVVDILTIVCIIFFVAMAAYGLYLKTCGISVLMAGFNPPLTVENFFIVVGSFSTLACVFCLRENHKRKKVRDEIRELLRR